MYMIRIGLTGVSGSGKSYVTKIFAKYGISSVNSDAIVHELYASKNSCTEAIANLFGEQVLFSDHSVNRKKLAAIVFSSRDKLQLLNKTVHPFVLDKINQIVQEHELQGAKAFLIEAPQLFESGLHELCDLVVSVLSEHDLRITRLIARDGISKEMAERRIANQFRDSFFREHSDFCIENNEGDDLEKQVYNILSIMGLVT